MPYPIYKLIHFAGIFLVLLALAAMCMHALRGGTRASDPHRRALAIAHGIGTFLILLGGFGMLARLGIVQAGLPGWIYAKLAIWVVVGGAIALAYRSRGLARLTLLAAPVLAVLAAAVALYKPF
jgi:Invasion gene expression up-regulator, SirB